jgi:8-oxo-dGTP pyrophosphatase MutT (NUDIX family)
MVWKPRVTVAVVAERNGRYLLVEETVAGRNVLNQPAGHLEDGESLVDAAIRECQEETAWRFQPEAIVGVYRWRSDRKQDTYLRVTFAGNCSEHLPESPLDTDIIAAHWLSLDDIQARRSQLRSPLVMQSLNDYLSGRRYPLDMLVDIDGDNGG